MKEAELNQRLPFANVQYTSVTFPASANMDLVVKHTLGAFDPNSVGYLPIGQEGDGDIYHDTSPTRRAWGNNYIILRASVANLEARLLLFTERP